VQKTVQCGVVIAGRLSFVFVTCRFKLSEEKCGPMSLKFLLS